jgi:hypothetical protein
VEWFVWRDRAFVVVNGDRIEGVALVRYVRSTEEAERPYDDCDGPVCYVDLAVARSNRAFKDLFALRMGHRSVPFIAWARNKYQGRAIIKRMKEAARRFGYGQISTTTTACA